MHHTVKHEGLKQTEEEPGRQEPARSIVGKEPGPPAGQEAESRYSRGDVSSDGPSTSRQPEEKPVGDPKESASIEVMGRLTSLFDHCISTHVSDITLCPPKAQ